MSSELLEAGQGGRSQTFSGRNNDVFEKYEKIGFGNEAVTIFVRSGEMGDKAYNALMDY